MPESKKQTSIRDPLPEEFGSLEEFWAFWDIPHNFILDVEQDAFSSSKSTNPDPLRYVRSWIVKKLIAFAGLDPVVSQSGRFEVKYRAL